MVLPPKMAALSPTSAIAFRINPLTQALKITLEKPRKPTLLECFSELKDPRLDRRKRHLLEDNSNSHFGLME